jgi:hypothetical protein
MNRDFVEMLAAVSEARAEFQVNLWGQLVPVIGRSDLILTKRADGRPRDLADIADLEAKGETGGSEPA